MSLPSEYVIGDALRSMDDMIVYRAEHPIHGTVNIYLPDNNLPWELSGQVKKRLYQNGRHMRNMSLLDMPFVTKALEVSQNPNEPYIVTKHEEHDLEEFIGNGVVIKPKRMFSILLQAFDAIMNLTANGWVVGRLHPRQIKVPQTNTGNISFNVIEGAEQWIEMAKKAAAVPANELRRKIKKPSNQNDIREEIPVTTEITQKIDKSKPPKQGTEAPQIKDEHRQLMATQRNIYLLGNITYQLLFGRKYEAIDKLAAVNIKKLSRRWRKILEKALGQNSEYHYDRYATIKRDVNKALNRNKRLAVASIPFWLLLILITSYYSYEKYHEHKIMTSEAGQAIKSFLDIVNKTNNEIPEIEKSQTPPPRPDDSTILEPFDEIKPLSDAKQSAQ